MAAATLVAATATVAGVNSLEARCSLLSSLILLPSALPAFVPPTPFLSREI